jgi:hypothetical protein
MTWRLRRLHEAYADPEFAETLRQEITDLSAEGIACLERVREANAQMRAAHAAATTENERLRALLRAQETP